MSGSGLYPIIKCLRTLVDGERIQRQIESVRAERIEQLGRFRDADDYVVGAGIAAEGKQLLTVTENGYGKRTEIEEYLRLGEDGARHPQQRGGKGLKNYNLTAKTGLVAGVAIVEDGEDVMLVENGGVLIRMPVDSINIYKRDTQGVILMRVDEGSRVISIERVDREEEEPETPVEE